MTKQPRPSELIGEDFFDRLIAHEQSSTDSRFESGYDIIDGWEEVQYLFNDIYGERSGFAKYKAGICGKVGLDDSTIRHRVRVCKAVPRELKAEHDVPNYSQWRAMLSGDKENEENVLDNLEWFYEEMDKRAGSPPSPIDIRDHANGTEHDPVWKKQVDRLVKQLTAILDNEKAPDWVAQVCRVALDTIKANQLKKDETNHIG